MLRLHRRSMEEPLVDFKHDNLCLHSHPQNIQLINKLDSHQQPIATHSNLREVKVTLDASSKYVKNKYGENEHHINQYILKEEIGRGSFGAVHYAVDQSKTEYAIKVISKSRLRRRSQSSIIRKPQHDRAFQMPLAASCKTNRPYTAQNIHRAQQLQDPLYLIKGEMEVMKRANHPNVLRLIEVLDDPEEDSLYMVLELCLNDVVTKVGIGERANSQSPEKCKKWFRQIISGLEHLHKQGIVHRDIKPDNLLLTEDNILKIADFGDSEIFEIESDMMIFKSAGSPAFTPPELCVMNHGYVSGTAADIWSLGVSLYCMRFGYLPFEHEGILDLYDAIRSDELKLDVDLGQELDFHDLMTRLLEKDPDKRAKIEEIKIHPWFTTNCSEPLPKSSMLMSGELTKTQAINIDKRVIKPTITDQKSDREIREKFPSMILAPFAFETTLKIYSLSRGTSDNEQKLNTQMNASQKIIPSDAVHKFLRQRNDSGISMNDFEFEQSNNPHTGCP